MPQLEFDGQTFVLPDAVPPPQGSAVARRVAMLGACGAVSTMLGAPTFVRALLLVGGALVAFLVLVTLAILVGGKAVSAKLAGVVVPRVMAKINAKFAPMRRELLRGLSGDVLDVGAGGGPYIEWAAELAGEKVTSYVALEPNPNMAPHLAKASAGVPFKFETTRSFIEQIEGKFKFDWIILGNVLCEVPDQRSALMSVHRLLKPGGKVFFSEHVRDEDGTWYAWLQDLMAPWWVLVSDGCNCNRSTMEMIEAVFPSDCIFARTYRAHSFPWTDKHVMGLAIKKGLSAKRSGAT